MTVLSRIPAEWRVPIAFAVLWVTPFVVTVSRPSWWERLHGQGSERVGVAFSLVFLIVLIGALLSRSRFAWWVLVVIYLGGFASWLQHVLGQGLGASWTLWGGLALLNFSLLVSAPMRRFVRLRGRLAPDPR